MGKTIAYHDGIYAVDANYVRPGLAAVHLLIENGRAAVIDSGTSHSLPAVIEALQDVGLGVEAVDYVLLTHVHLDHAGGAGTMMQAFPSAKLVVHPRGARHMIDPTKLIAGTQAVYGVEATTRLYGEILPIEAARVVEAADGLTVSLAGRALLCIDTPGHARHHIAIVDPAGGAIFAGDNFGVSYRELDCPDRQFVFPTTTPVQFEPEAMHATIDRLLCFSPRAMYLTHFGELRNPAARAGDLHRQIDAQVRVALAAQGEGSARHDAICAGIEEVLRDELLRYDGPLPLEQAFALYGNDVELNAQGLAVWLDSRAPA